MILKYTAVIFLASIASGCWQNYSNGERIGVPFKLSRKGVFCKTWEGSANLGGMREESDGKSTSMVPNIWNFTIRDEDMPLFGPMISDAIENGDTIKFKYMQEWLPVCYSDEGYYIVELKIVHGAKK